MSSRLNPEDQQRVSDYLSAPQHQIERLHRTISECGSDNIVPTKFCN